MLRGKPGRRFDSVLAKLIFLGGMLNSCLAAKKSGCFATS
jgi:hypothetical protein